MEMTVWVEGWQMQCCGEPFHVGSQVSWTLLPSNASWLRPLLPAGTDVTIDAAEERHGDAPDGTAATAGTVSAITAIHHRYAPKPGEDARTLYPVPGSAALSAITSADGWTPDDGDLRFVGYLVRLAT